MPTESLYRFSTSNSARTQSLKFLSNRIFGSEKRTQDSLNSLFIPVVESLGPSVTQSSFHAGSCCCGTILSLSRSTSAFRTIQVHEVIVGLHSRKTLQGLWEESLDKRRRMDWWLDKYMESTAMRHILSRNGETEGRGKRNDHLRTHMQVVMYHSELSRLSSCRYVLKATPKRTSSRQRICPW